MQFQKISVKSSKNRRKMFVINWKKFANHYLNLAEKNYNINKIDKFLNVTRAHSLGMRLTSRSSCSFVGSCVIYNE